MSLTYPLVVADFWEQIPIASLEFDLATYESGSMTAAGEIIESQKALPKWYGRASLASGELMSAPELEALLSRIIGAGKTFRAYDPSGIYAKADTTGSTLAGATIQINSAPSTTTISLKGLPASFVVNVGDYISVPSRKVLVQAIESITANGSGTTGTFTVRGNNSGLVANDSVSMNKPQAFFKIVPGTLQKRQKLFIGKLTDGATFDFIQVMQ